MYEAIENCLLEERYSLGIKKISEFLIKIGIYPKLKGFTLLLYAVLTVLKNPESIHSITTTLYPTVAKAFGVSVACVERNMRNAIETAYNSGKLQETANRFYGGNFKKYEKPTNGEFISYMVSIVKFSTF
ncbi:MAG: sporulation initiation factor Spo0A C-terminal domain-containing protein [Clostridia bacterium]|nr:sporulation initiation factor Spo0A C-terminal domain-containing protein [Clostridia bacterium]